MLTAKFLGMVRVWHDGEQWRWVPVGQWAPEEALTGKRLRDGDEEVIQVQYSATCCEFICGAVKGD